MMNAASKKKLTPNYDHVLDDKVLRTNVYEPEADSFLFLDALDADIHVIGDRVAYQIGKAISGNGGASFSTPPVVFRILEVGPGSGIVITHMGMLLRTYLQERAAAAAASMTSPTDGGDVSVVVEFHGIDMNPMAVQAATETWRRNMIPSSPTNSAFSDDSTPASVPIATLNVPTSTSSPASTTTRASVLFQAHFVTGDLFQVEGRSSCGTSSEEGRGGTHKGSYYDIVLFNPPYVPTDDSELQDALDKKDLITAAWCGGPRGRVVVDRFFRDISQWWYPSITKNHHVLCYVVAIRQNEPADMAHLFGDCVFSSWSSREGATSSISVQLQEVGDIDESETKMVVSGGGSCTRAAPPLPAMSGEGTMGVIGSASTLQFGARAIAARYTGEHLSILKFEAALKQ